MAMPQRACCRSGLYLVVPCFLVAFLLKTIPPAFSSVAVAGRNQLRVFAPGELGLRRRQWQQGLTSREGEPSGAAVVSKDIGGNLGEALLTGLVAGASVFTFSRFQMAIHRQMWVPPFGAIVLIFAAEAVAAAKQGKIMDVETLLQRAVKTGVGVVGACVLTVGVAQLLGGSPSVLRATGVFLASVWMSLAPASGYFPPAGALCALFIERVVGKGALPGFEYALFPCATGTMLLLIFTRAFTTVLARPFWAIGARSAKS
eukprot:TRINITY_DN96445_c0_g1_i1.p1 TRINITY_DN96445_c0_g1~~TRINITY_DN96445_c0_g1_i1.p1  ORF type:complete len:259 (+),score=19.86 TRINITY_DN96445_c0_g1_i1:36-812(+)